MVVAASALAWVWLGPRGDDSCSCKSRGPWATLLSAWWTVNVDERARLRMIERWAQLPLTDDTVVSGLASVLRRSTMRAVHGLGR